MISSYGFSTNEVPFMSRKPVVLLFLATLVAAPAIPQTAIAQNAIAKTAVAQRTASQAVGPALGIPSTAIAINSPTPLSQRVVHYAIDAKYDPRPTHSTPRKPSPTTTSPARRSTRFPSTFISTPSSHLHLDSRDQT